jgi:hypothetical protein
MISNVDIKDGKLRSIAIRTDALEFSYSFYEQDGAVALFMSRKLDSEHRRTIDAFVSPDVARKLIDAFVTGQAEEKETTVGGLWKRVLDIADVVANNVDASETASVRIGSNIVRHNGIVVTLGYEQEQEAGKYRVFAEAEWRDGKFTCHAYERDVVQDVKNLKYYVQNVLFFVELCL